MYGLQLSNALTFNALNHKLPPLEPVKVEWPTMVFCSTINTASISYAIIYSIITYSKDIKENLEAIILKNN